MVGSAKPTLREACAARSEAWLADVQALVDKSVSDLERQREKLAAREAALDARAAALTAQVEALAAEKAALLGGRGPGDVLRLSVAGQECVVLRRTLCQVEDSMLASQFSGRWDKSLAKDDEGRIFVDAPPDLFLPIVDWLRQKAIEDPSKPVDRLKAIDVQVPQHRQPAFDRLVEYYGLAALYKASAEASGCSTWLKSWGSGNLKNRTLTCTGDNDIGVAIAMCDVGSGTFVVRKTDTNQPWYNDSFRFGLVKDDSVCEMLQQECRSQQGDQIDSQHYTSPAHGGLFPALPDSEYKWQLGMATEIQVSIEFLDGAWKATFRTPCGQQGSISPCGGQGSWHLVFAVTYPWIEVELKPPLD